MAMIITYKKVRDSYEVILFRHFIAIPDKFIVFNFFAGSNDAIEFSYIKLVNSCKEMVMHFCHK